jgi:hypothetical protein
LREQTAYSFKQISVKTYLCPMIYLPGFKEQWDEPFEKVKDILSYMSTYPEMLEMSRIYELIEPERVDEGQEDWLRLLTKLDHPLEKDFFKPFWVPINKNSYDHFIDLSDPALPVFEGKFYFIKPYRWFKDMVVSDVTRLLLAFEEGTDLESALERWDPWSGDPLPK